VPSLEESAAAPPETWPKLSIVIPACNEAASLESALSSVLAQDYPDLEVILIDDRSSDGTAAIVDRIAAADRRIIAMHVQQLPEGWLGKVNALALGTEKSSGQWLLFTDADVHMSPGVLRQAVAYAVQHSMDHMAAVPDFWPNSLLVDANVALFCRTFMVAMRLWAVADASSDAYIGVGAFNLVRRAALLRTEGFAWLRMEVGDDLGLGMMLKQSGGRSCLVNGHNRLGLHWYRNLEEMNHGAEKGYASVGHCSLCRMAALAAALVLLEWSPLVALASWRIPGLFWSGIAMLAAAVGCSLMVRWRSRRRVLPALLFPLAAIVSAGITLRSGWLGHRRGGIMWRGTLYPDDQLLAGRRLRFP
jgi:cellulose synthase/poly-beta-1,6-N-acetylglucosamine synthase-like glycosyltransferase